MLSNNELYLQNISHPTMADETYEEDRKLFVGGLPQECTQDDLKVIFIPKMVEF